MMLSSLLSSLRLKGASVISYSLVVGLVSVFAITGIHATGGKVQKIFDDSRDAIEDPLSAPDRETAPEETGEDASRPAEIGPLGNYGDLEPLQEVLSSPAQITGLSSPAFLSVSGGDNPLLRVGSPGSWGGWTASTGNVQDGDHVQVRALAPSSYSQSETITLTGDFGIQATMVLTTADPAPVAVSFADFAPKANVEPGEVITSSPQNVEALSRPVAVSIASFDHPAHYRKSPDGITWSPWTSSESSDFQGGYIQVRIEAPLAFGANATIELAVDNTTGEFSITTRDPVLAPSGYTDFSSRSNIEPDTDVTSNTQVISGIEDTSPVSATGGEYSIRDTDGTWGEWTTDPGEIEPGEAVRMRLSASSSLQTTASANLNIGGVIGSFRVTTRAARTGPVNFVNFTPETDLEPGEQALSNIQYLTGMETAVQVSSSGGEFRVQEGGAWSGWRTSSTTLSNQESPGVQVRLSASSSYGASRSMSLTVGDVTRSYSVTTRSANQSAFTFSNFTSESDVPPSTSTTSNAQTITGLEGSATASVSGSGADFRYDNGSGWSSWRTSPASIRSGSRVQVRLVSSSSHLSGRTATLTIGSKSRTFSVTTREANTTPAGFADFTTENDVQPGDYGYSNIQDIQGLEAAADIHISGGEYRKRTSDGSWGSWKSSNGTIEPDSDVQVRIQAGALGDSKSASITIGGVARSFTVESTSYSDLGWGNFPDTRKAERNTLLTSDTHFINQYGTPFLISTSSSNIPVQYRYSNDSLNWSSWRSSDSSGFTGGYIQARATSSGSWETEVTARLTIGGAPVKWDIKTREKAEMGFYDWPQTTIAHPENDSRSSIQEITNLSGPVPISVGSEVEYRIRDASGSWSSWRTSSGTVPVGGAVQLRTDADHYWYNYTRHATIDGKTRSWVLDVDRVPSSRAKNFPSKTTSRLGETVSSQKTSYSFNGKVDITAKYSLVSGMQVRANNGSGWSSWTGSGTIGNFQSGQIQVRMTSPGSSGKTKTGDIQIGGRTVYFTLTTQ